ncbi:hypothetical protein OHA18_37935 [Kribbella sp. NBC_00709]|uniref:hypothetical protein n=1 Tax=Kribbella sp. NBC_00709 TaxID=2975972 RepID=UPI002E2BB029|nr:hypothetical protein [Kribbella sp. NBC_00709]
MLLGVVALLLLSPEVLALAFLTGLLAGATAATMYSAGDTARWTRRQVITAAAAGAALIVLAGGLAVVLGPSVLWLVVLLGGSSPPVVRWCTGMRGTAPRRRDVPERSTADLCRQWRDSYDALRQAKTDPQRLRIVMERQRCLDELDRRDPEGLQAWLASAASAAGDPTRFLKNL